MVGIHPPNGQGAIIIHTASVRLFDWICYGQIEMKCYVFICHKWHTHLQSNSKVQS